MSVGMPPVALTVPGQERYKQANDYLIAHGPTTLCKNGEISVLRYKQYKDNVDEFKRDLLQPSIPLEALTED